MATAANTRITESGLLFGANDAAHALRITESGLVAGATNQGEIRITESGVMIGVLEPPASTSSSLSLAPAATIGTCRNCVRLANPDKRTEEAYAQGSLTIQIWLPFDQVLKYAPMIGNYGLDYLKIYYTDYLGQAGEITRLVSFTASDEGWIFLSADQGTQFLVSNVDGVFYDQNAAAINARNVSFGVPALKACGDPRRYDYPLLLVGQVRPSSAFLRDGVVVK